MFGKSRKDDLYSVPKELEKLYAAAVVEPAAIKRWEDDAALRLLERNGTSIPDFSTRVLYAQRNTSEVRRLAEHFARLSAASSVRAAAERAAAAARDIEARQTTCKACGTRGEAHGIRERLVAGARVRVCSDCASTAEYLRTLAVSTEARSAAVRELFKPLGVVL